MPKIKKIKEIESKIKKVEPSKKHKDKSELIEEIQEEDSENFTKFINSPRSLEAIDPSLEQSDITEEARLIRTPLSSEEEDDVSLRPSYDSGGGPNYGGSNTYDENTSYEPTNGVGGEGVRETSALSQNQLPQGAERRTGTSQTGEGGEQAFQRDYAGKESDQEKSKKRRMF